MPPSNTRAALAAATPASASAMVSLTSSFGTVRVTGRRAVFASSSPSSSPFSTSTSSSALCCRQQSSSLPALTASRRAAISVSGSSTSRSPLSSSKVAAFSTTSARESMVKRRMMRQWFKTIGKRIYGLEPKGPSEHLETERARARLHPFPFNDTFISQSILHERMRESVWKRVRVEGQSVKSVAASAGIDMRRVAAVVRLKEIEKQWIAEGKPLAHAYSDAVQSMIRTHKISAEQRGEPFENINEIHTHAYTKQQLFVPVSESRQFTREDAARAFHRKMLSADKRMPIPELIQVEKELLSDDADYETTLRNFHKKASAEQDALAKADREAAVADEARTKRVDTDRFEFRIRDINADNVGPKGRSPHAVGWRYGVPFDDRKRGQVKIPTKVG